MDENKLKNAIADLVYDRLKEYCEDNNIEPSLELFSIITEIREYDERN